MSVKQARLESIIRKELTEIIRNEVKDPKLGFVTITDVELTNDYSYAKVYLSFLKQDPKHQYGLEVLERAKGLIRTKLAARLTIRKCPELIFKIDDSLDRADRVESLLNRIHDDSDDSGK